MTGAVEIVGASESEASPALVTRRLRPEKTRRASWNASQRSMISASSGKNNDRAHALRRLRPVHVQQVVIERDLPAPQPRDLGAAKPAEPAEAIDDLLERRLPGARHRLILIGREPVGVLAR